VLNVKNIFRNEEYKKQIEFNPLLVITEKYLSLPPVTKEISI